MRVSLPIGRLLLFTAAFILALAALLPMRLAIDWFGWGTRGIAAREVNGSVWFGTLKEAQIGGIGAGDLRAGLRGLPLLVGRARIAFDRVGTTGAAGLDGAVEATSGSFGVADMDGSLAIGTALAPLPISAVQLTGLEARFVNSRCDTAGGTVRAEVAGDLAGLNLPGGLNGTARCDGEALLLPLASQSGMETLELRLFGDGRFQAAIVIRSTDAALGTRLQQNGFSPGGGGFMRIVSGRL